MRYISGFREADLIKIADNLSRLGMRSEDLDRPSGERVLARIAKIVVLADTNTIDKVLLRAEQEDLKAKAEAMLRRVQEIDHELRDEED